MDKLEMKGHARSRPGACAGVGGDPGDGRDREAPARPRRYDRRFFSASASLIATSTGQSDEELQGIGWFSVDEAKALDLPPITRVIFEKLGDRISAGPLGPLGPPIPFYHHRRGSFIHEMLAVGA
jgi:hypothetical protein